MKKIIVTPKGQFGIFDKVSSNGKIHYYILKPDGNITRSSININDRKEDFCEVTLTCIIPKHLLEELE